ncbi:MAG: aspartate aminotransferase family protein [Hyphomicrobiales bacterium]
MPIDIADIVKKNESRNYTLHDAHVNPRFAKALKIIGFDKCYVRGEGTYLWDDEGTKYLDTLAGYGVWNVGRNNPDVRKALNEFLALDYPGLVQIEAPLLSGLLAEELKNRVGYGLDIVYFTSTGAEGNETAIKFARRASGKPKILYASNAFHGLTNGALALNGSEVFRENFGPLVPDTIKVPFNDVQALEIALRNKDVAAFMIEPVQGKGVHIATDEYLAAATRLCREYGAFLVADEVQSGVGRTGKFLASHHYEDFEPDMVIVSKSLSGGHVPVGAVLARKEIYDKVFSSLDRAVVHSSTFGQGSFAMVAGLASLAALDDGKLMENATRVGDMLGNRLLEMKDRYEFIHDIRWRGLMLGIEFGKPSSLKLKTAWAAVNGLNADLFCQGVTIPLLQDHHILSQVSGNKSKIIKLIPPLTMSEKDVDWFCAGFEKVMEDLHKFPGPLWEGLMRIGKNAMASGGTAQNKAASL